MFFSISILFNFMFLKYLLLMFGYNSFFLSIKILILSFIFFFYYCFFNLWFSLIFFLIYMGGLLVLFFYIFSLKSNPKLLIKLKILWLFPFFCFFLFYKKKLKTKNSFFKNNFFYKYNFDLLKKMYYLIILCLFLLYVLFLMKKFLFNFNSFIRFFK